MELYGRNDAAKYLNVSTGTFDRLVQAGEIKPDTHTAGGRRKYKKTDLDHCKKRLQDGTASTKPKTAEEDKAEAKQNILLKSMATNVRSGNKATAGLTSDEIDYAYENCYLYTYHKKPVDLTEVKGVLALWGTFGTMWAVSAFFMWKTINAAGILKLILILIACPTIAGILTVIVGVPLAAAIFLRNEKKKEKFVDKAFPALLDDLSKEKTS